MPKCPKCKGKLIDVGCYKWDCPNDCYPVSLELWQMENELTDECEHEFEQDMDEVFCKLCGERQPNNPEYDTDSLQGTRPDLFNSNGTRKTDY